MGNRCWWRRIARSIACMGCTSSKDVAQHGHHKIVVKPTRENASDSSSDGGIAPARRRSQEQVDADVSTVLIKMKNASLRSRRLTPMPHNFLSKGAIAHEIDQRSPSPPARKPTPELSPRAKRRRKTKKLERERVERIFKMWDFDDSNVIEVGQ